MAYHFKSGESVPEGVRRIAREEIDSAAAELSAKRGAARDEGIHEARKGVKKVRALLRLMRPELGAAYRAESDALRDIGHTLSEFRDAGAMIETFDNVRERYGGEKEAARLGPVRRGLIASKRTAERSGGIDAVLKKTAAALDRIGKRVKTWPLAENGFAAIAPGMEETFRRGRKALKAARKHPKPESYHEWRKRVKDHWYHVRLVENLWTDVLQAYERSLKDLETWLGEDHNLVLLRERVAAEPARYGSAKTVSLFLSLIDRFQMELRENALSAGERIYSERPREFIRRTQALWEAWEAQGQGLEEIEKQRKEAAHAIPAGIAASAHRRRRPA
jgi:CHAD domain-containing protein